MKRVKNVLLLTVMSFSLAFTACQEDAEVLDIRNKITRPPQGAPGGLTGQPGGHPYPEIIEQYYPVDLTHYQGCEAWRIEWPNYPDNINLDMIPTFFATSTGNLNSLNFLLNTHPANKNNATFSLYTDEKVEAASQVSELWDWTGVGAEAVYFRKIDKTADQIEKWVTNRPSNFENYWDDAGDIETAIEYQAGDFFIFQLPGQSPVRYGGIRIVSMSPRIIEAYFAIPN
ncbi:MAG: hypothetical protein AAF944_27340 [Bacteroidota bacterium]